MRNIFPWKVKLRFISRGTCRNIGVGTLGKPYGSPLPCSLSFFSFGNFNSGQPQVSADSFPPPMGRAPCGSSLPSPSQAKRHLLCPPFLGVTEGACRTFLFEGVLLVFTTEKQNIMLRRRKSLGNLRRLS